MNTSFTISGNLVDVHIQTIYAAEITVVNGKIAYIKKAEGSFKNYILPGFIDSHVHIESSMLIPSEFARLAVVHGTVATVSDPHEIANVCGMKGIEYMIENGKKVNFKFNFGAPGCVPATTFETAGATINSDDIKVLLQREEIKYLSEVMNFPGVLMKNEEVMKKITAAKEVNKPVDGHAPGLRGKDAKQYIEAGISTDHECFTKEEALDKLQYGMKILIREGSAAKNFEALIDLLNSYEDSIMFCSDDKHPDSLVEGHINQLCAKAVAKGIDIFKVLKAACVNPVLHYKLNVGLLKEGDAADFILMKDLQSFDVIAAYINGELVAENGKTKIDSIESNIINHFTAADIAVKDVAVYKNDYPVKDNKIPVVEALEGQLITNKLWLQPKMNSGNELISNIENDILKMVVVNRYNKATAAKAFVKNMGLQQGAIASSVAHDSHNIIAVGADDESIVTAVNLIIKQRGGIAAVNNCEKKVLPLPVAGLMSNDDGYKVAAAYTAIDAMAKQMGSKLSAPFMTLSFLALLVIPHLKLSDKGLFDGDGFSFL